MYRKNGESHQKEPGNTISSVDSSVCVRCYMATETASHILYDCVALAEFRFRRLGQHFYGIKLLCRDYVM
jgi:hypothetical protein